MADADAPVDLPADAGAAAETEEVPGEASTAAASSAPPEAKDVPPPEDVSEEGWQTVKPKRRGRPPGSKNKPKIVALPPERPPEPEVTEEEDEEDGPPPPPRAPLRVPRYRPKQPETQPVYAPPTFGHRDLGSILSEHLLQVETQKRLSQQEMHARLVRGVL